ncbi:MAG: hypothetical protein LRS43_03155 [Desulfurococcales archaeon]|nr:hypothetical protein [Desulfurococcales archaeon]
MVKAGARLGVQTLVAVILLTLVVATAAIAIYTWLSGVVSTSPTEAQTLKERIRIDAISYNTTDGINITVRNIGDVKVTISGAYILDPDTETLVAEIDEANVLPIDINPGETGLVWDADTVPGAGNKLQSGEVYLVKVVTASGIEARATFIAP